MAILNSVFAALVAVLISFSPAAGQHVHEGNRDARDEHHRGGDEMHGTAEAEPAPIDYIRVDTPAGRSAIIGRKNRVPILEPQIISAPDGSPVKLFRLTVDKVTFEMYPGKFIDGWGFNGSIPGPTIKVREGDRIRIIMENNTDTAHTLHVHGQKKPVSMDGVPYIGQNPVGKGESYTYEFTVQNPGTHWYHCHVDSAHHVDMGMYGAFIVEPKDEDIEYDREYVLILDEWPTGHIHVHDSSAPMGGHEEHGVVTEHPGEPRHEHDDGKPVKRDWYPETYAPYQPVYDGFTINGKSFPFTEPLDVREGERVRIRIINAGYQSHYIHSHSHRFIVVARSGSPVNEPQKIDTTEVGAGQRIDIILFADNPGIWPFHCHRLNHIENDHIYPGGMMTFIRYRD